ncbi:PEP-CTERM sorting domain-containing protein [bacterium]|nr:PEP-CTERM sorting domain-containing protein [bacterium]
MKIKKLTCLAAFALACFTAHNVMGQTEGLFDLRFEFATGVTAQQQADLQPSLDATESFWESIIPGYQQDVTLDGIIINVDVQMIDGSGGPNGNILATGGPGPGAPFDQAGFSFITNGTVFTNGTSTGVTSSVGNLTVDSADFSTSLIVDVLKHEVGHALGFGTLFDFGMNNLVTAAGGQYIGPEGLAAYQAEFNATTATFIPLDQDNGHYIEASNLTDQFGRIFGDELLTPIIENTPNAMNPDVNYVSDTTIAVLRDLGYNAVAPVAIPEPSSMVLLALGGLVLCRRRR